MLDSSIPLSARNAELPDPLELQKSYREMQTAKKQGRMSDLLLAGAERDNTKALEADKKARTIKGLLQVNTEVGPNGAPALNKGRLIGDLGRLGYTQEAMDFQKQDQVDQAAAMKAKRQEFTEKLGLMGQILGGHSAQNYPVKYAALKALGFDESDGIPDPANYNPEMIDGALKQGLTYKERLELEDKDENRKDSRSKQAALEKKAAADALLAQGNAAETKRHNMATEGIQRMAAQKVAKGKPEDALTLDEKEKIKVLASGNARKIAIANQIESALKQISLAADDDTKVRLGRGMLKILNSTEGADAIGAEEAKRLGDALEYNIFDLSAGLGMKPGKLIGRDMKGFEDQAGKIAAGIRGSINANQAEIDKVYNRSSAAAPAGGQEFDYVPGQGLVPKAAQ